MMFRMHGIASTCTSPVTQSLIGIMSTESSALFSCSSGVMYIRWHGVGGGAYSLISKGMVSH